MKYAYWIQGPDFNANDYDAVDVNGAIAVFKGNNWTEVEKARDLRENKDDEYCDPGIGIVPGDGRILHIALNKGNEFYIHYHFKKEGLFGTSDKTASKMSTDIADIPYFIELFFSGDHDSLIKQMQA